MTIDEIRKEVKRLDPKVSDDSLEFKTAVVLLSATQVGPAADRISRFSGIPRVFVRDKCQKFREGGIFKNGKIHCEWFKNNGGMAFWLDVAVGMGWLNRSTE